MILESNKAEMFPAKDAVYRFLKVTYVKVAKRIYLKL